MTTWREHIKMVIGEDVLPENQTDKQNIVDEMLNINMSGDCGSASLCDYDGFVVYTPNFVCANYDYDGYDILVCLHRNPE